MFCTIVCLVVCLSSWLDVYNHGRLFCILSLLFYCRDACLWPLRFGFVRNKVWTNRDLNELFVKRIVGTYWEISVLFLKLKRMSEYTNTTKVWLLNKVKVKSQLIEITRIILNRLKRPPSTSSSTCFIIITFTNKKKNFFLNNVAQILK